MLALKPVHKSSPGFHQCLVAPVILFDDGIAVEQCPDSFSLKLKVVKFHGGEAARSTSRVFQQKYPVLLCQVLREGRLINFAFLHARLGGGGLLPLVGLDVDGDALEVWLRADDLEERAFRAADDPTLEDARRWAAAATLLASTFWNESFAGRAPLCLRPGVWSSTRVAFDLSGRPYCDVQLELKRWSWLGEIVFSHPLPCH